MTLISLVHQLPDLGTAFELRADEGAAEPLERFKFQLDEPPGFVVATLTDVDGRPAGGDRSGLALSADGQAWREPRDEAQVFVDPSHSVLVICAPQASLWTVEASLSRPAWQRVNVAAVHRPATRKRRQPTGLPGLLPATCKTCQMLTKALALAISTLVVGATIPAALIAAVAQLLGMLALAAGAFIASLLGDTAQSIAEALCKRLGYCP